MLRSGTPLLPSEPVSQHGNGGRSARGVEPRFHTADHGDVQTEVRPSELWDAAVTVSSFHPSNGVLTATKTHANGGVFDLTFNLQPVLTFTRVSDGSDAVLDTGAEGFPPLPFGASGVSWVHSLDPSLPILAPWDGLFVPGVAETVPGDPSSQLPETIITETPSTSVRHSIDPTFATQCPLVFETPLDPCFARRQECVGSVDKICWPHSVDSRETGDSVRLP